MWCIVGTVPQADFPLTFGPYSLEGGHLCLGEIRLPVERGTAALAAAAWLTCKALGGPPPQILLGGDIGQGKGSREVYAWLTQHLGRMFPESAEPVGTAQAHAVQGLTFHYLFPDVDWHNKVLLALEALPKTPLLVADAGFMYVAKMSGYADSYDLFTPDAGEMAFLADEEAPHPFYTRGFLLGAEDDIPTLIQRARQHGNCPRNLIVKGSTDHVIVGERVQATIDSPSVDSMEAIGGTGDIVTGMVSGLLASGLPLPEACVCAVQASRDLAALAQPTPATQVGALLQEQYFCKVFEVFATQASTGGLYSVQP